MTRSSGRGRVRVVLWAIVAMVLHSAATSPVFAGAGEAADGGSARPTRTFSLQFGQSSPDDFTSILTSPWSVSFNDTQVFIASASHLVWEIDEHVWLDGEVGVSRRIGDSDAWEMFGLVFLRWDGLPWSDWLYTSIGVGMGPSFVTEVSELEREKSGNGEGSRTLNMLVPEIAIALPEHKDIQLTFRLHHRSGVFGLVNGVDGGSAFLTAGVRVGF